MGGGKELGRRQILPDMTPEELENVLLEDLTAETLNHLFRDGRQRGGKGPAKNLQPPTGGDEKRMDAITPPVPPPTPTGDEEKPTGGGSVPPAPATAHGRAQGSSSLK